MWLPSRGEEQISLVGTQTEPVARKTFNKTMKKKLIKALDVQSQV